MGADQACFADIWALQALPRVRHLCTALLWADVSRGGVAKHSCCKVPACCCTHTQTLWQELFYIISNYFTFSFPFSLSCSSPHYVTWSQSSSHDLRDCDGWCAGLLPSCFFVFLKINILKISSISYVPSSIQYLTRETVDKSQLTILLTRVPGGDEPLLEVIVFPLIKMVSWHRQHKRTTVE